MPGPALAAVMLHQATRRIGRRLAAAAAAFFALMGLVISTLLLGSGDSAANCGPSFSTGPGVSIATWNVCGYACPDWAGRSRLAERQLANNPTDIVALQEAGWGESNYAHTAAMMKRLGYVTPHGNGPHRNRYIFYKSGQFEVDDYGTVDLGDADGLAWATLTPSGGGDTFLVANVHLAAGEGKDERRRQQMNTAVDRLRPQLDKAIPAIWVGDFNSHQDRAGDPPAQVLAGTGAVNARDVATSKQNADVDGYKGRTATGPVSRNGRQFAHIFVSRSIPVSSWNQVVNASGGRYTGPYITDHNMLTATLGLAPEPDSEHGTTPVQNANAPGRLSAESMRLAKIIADRGIAAGVGTEGVVIALATAMQESTMRNLDYGDRDSLGLFQQRPSTGWGTAAQVRDPALSADAFYGVAQHTNNPGLVDIANWQQMSVTEAAQAVQRSAFPDAYAQWEGLARELAAQLVGQVAATAPGGGTVAPGATGACQPGGVVAISGDWAAPLSGRPTKTSPYGMRVHPITGAYKLHTGQDFGAPAGTPLYAACSGQVLSAKLEAAGGNTTRISCGGGVTIVYMHQSRFGVSPGQSVSAGQAVGAVGSTGYSTGPHLHFEVHLNGITTDPLPFLAARGINL